MITKNTLKRAFDEFTRNNLKITKTQYKTNEDLKKNFKIKVPENFNFSYDIVDRYEQLEPGKRALVWCDDSGEEKIFSSAFSSKTSP